MNTKTISFKRVHIGKMFSAKFGERGDMRATFRKVDHNMGCEIKQGWKMPFLYDEIVEIEIPDV